MNSRRLFPLMLYCILSLSCKAESRLTINGTVLETKLNGKEVDVLVKIDDGVFQIDQIDIDLDNLVLHEDVVRDVENSEFFKTNRKLIENSEKVLSGYPDIRKDIQRKMDALKSRLMQKYHLQEQWVSYNMMSNGMIEDSEYFVIVLTDSDRTYSGYIYITGPNPEHYKVKQLVPGLFSSMLSCEVVNLEKILVFTEEDNKTIVTIVRAQ